VKRADEVRRWRTAGALGLLAAVCWSRQASPGDAGAEEPGEYVYVTKEDSRNITVIDARDASVVTTIEVGNAPARGKVSPDGRSVYVALSGSPKRPPARFSDAECEKQKPDPAKDGVAVVDVVSRRLVRTLPAGSDPEAFDVSPDGSRLFVSNENAGSASIIDLAKGTVILSAKTGTEPEGVRFAPDGRIFWVTAETDRNVTGIDTQSGAVVGVIEVALRPSDRLRRWRREGLRHQRGGRHGSVVDMAARKVVKTIAMPEGSRPHRLMGRGSTSPTVGGTVSARRVDRLC
jgi:YVTN family beta-propeller protein